MQIENICNTCGQEIIKKRTIPQNSALHLWFAQLAEVLNDAGFDIRTTLKEDFDIPWSPETVKSLIWKPVQMAYKRDNSTTRLSTKDVDRIYDIIVRELGEKKGVECPPFPSIDLLIEDN